MQAAAFRNGNVMSNGNATLTAFPDLRSFRQTIHTINQLIGKLHPLPQLNNAPPGKLAGFEKAHLGSNAGE